jgi:hypothetical protein
MLAVRDKRTGKFLKSFSCSYNSFKSRTRYKLTITRALPLAEGERWPRYETVHSPSREEIHDAMFCLDSPDGAKLYTGKGGAESSIGGGYVEYIDEATGHKRWRSLPLAEGKPWLELVDVQTFERRRAAARKGAKTRRAAAGRPAKRKAKRKTARAA